MDRLAGQGDRTIAQEMKKVPAKGTHRIQARSQTGETFEAILQIKYQRLRVLPPLAKQKDYPALELTVIEARERRRPQGRPRIHWKLLTHLPVHSLQAAIEKLHWYALRWK